MPIVKQDNGDTPHSLKPIVWPDEAETAEVSASENQRLSALTKEFEYGYLPLEVNELLDQ